MSSRYLEQDAQKFRALALISKFTDQWMADTKVSTVYADQRLSRLPASIVRVVQYHTAQRPHGVRVPVDLWGRRL